MNIRTADLCDQLGPQARVCLGDWRHFGGKTIFSGPAATVSTFEDAGLVRQLLSQAGEGRVLVVDAGASLAAAVLGDRLAQLGIQNGWTGALISGAVRDTDTLRRLGFGVVALGSVPRRGGKTGAGTCHQALQLGGAPIHPGDWVHVDSDGVVVTSQPLP